MTFDEWWRGPREVPQTEAAAREAWSAAVAAERERWREAQERTENALRELERYEYATATAELRHAVHELREAAGPRPSGRRG